jgi:hypothetical protein
MSQSEVERHKTYEHSVPVLLFEERRSGSDTRKNNSNLNMEEIPNRTGDLPTSKTNNDNNITRIGTRQIGKVTLRTFSS